MRLDFEDKSIDYETFLRDIAIAVVKMIAESQDDPDVVSQRQAYEMFGRGNVERWVREGKIEPCKRPGKVEYKTAELRALQRKKQDYFK
jgi:hypothetical protein